MTEENQQIFDSGQKNQERTYDILEKLYDVAKPGAVFSEPVVAGEYTIITAAEVTAGAGVGFGWGVMHGTPKDEAAEDATQTETKPEPSHGGGNGGGGGGGAGSRPVAVISVGPSGVQIQPVVDTTKIGLALLTTLGSMFFMLARMRRGG